MRFKSSSRSERTTALSHAWSPFSYLTEIVQASSFNFGKVYSFRWDREQVLPCPIGTDIQESSSYLGSRYENPRWKVPFSEALHSERMEPPEDRVLIFYKYLVLVQSRPCTCSYMPLHHHPGYLEPGGTKLQAVRK